MHTSEGLIETLECLKRFVEDIREFQTAVPCAEDPDTGKLNYDPDDDICNYFDGIVDNIDRTIEKTKKHGQTLKQIIAVSYTHLTLPTN